MHTVFCTPRCKKCPVPMSAFDLYSVLFEASPACALHACEACDYSTSSKANLARHKRKHTGERAWFCRTCGKTCARSDDLRKHERIHDQDGGKIYACATCAYASSDISNLTRHCRKQNHVRARDVTMESAELYYCVFGNVRCARARTHISRHHCCPYPHLCLRRRWRRRLRRRHHSSPVHRRHHRRHLHRHPRHQGHRCCRRSYCRRYHHHR